MKAPSKRIISSFIAGGIVGTVITTVLFFSLFTSNNYKEEKTYALEVEKNNKKTDSEAQKKINTESEKETTSVNIKSDIATKTEKETIDTNEIVVEPKDTTTNTVAIDSMPADSSFITKSVEPDSSNGEIVIKKEKLLRTVSVTLVDILEIEKEETEHSDSLIEKVSGIKKTPTSSTYTLEYWESPVNFKGYKMANNKLVVYGIDPLPKATLYRFNEKIYLLHNGVCYQLDNTFAFKPFSSIKDETIIAQFK